MCDDNELLKSYKTRFDGFLKLDSLKEENILHSKKYFEKSSLLLGEPVPKKLDVYCIVAGLPFQVDFTNYLKNVKEKLSSILMDSLYYLVKDSCQAVELLVSKWPDDDFNENINEALINYFQNTQFKPITLRSKGVQIHDDGCIILRCIDENAQFRLLRKDIISKIDLLSKKQSSWVHIPIGRLLEPLDSKKTFLLKKFCLSSQSSKSYKATIDRFHFVHEHQWYQTNIDLLHTFNAI